MTEPERTHQRSLRVHWDQEQPPEQRKDVALTLATLSRFDVPGARDEREVAIGMLNTAAEIEHGVMIEYLFAAMTVEDPEAANVITGIAVEEMGHLLTVQNLLLFLDAEPCLHRQDQSPHPKVDPFTYRLAAGDRAVIAAFVAAEAPLPSNLGWLARWEMRRVWRDARDSVGKHAVHRVGALYARLRKDLAGGSELAQWQAPDAALARQASADEPWAHGGSSRRVIVRKVTSTKEAIDAIDAISSQGEGFECDDDTSHFARFRRLHRGMCLTSGLPASWVFESEPQLGVRELRPFWRALGGVSTRVNELRIGPPETATALSRLFDARYQVALLLIHEALGLDRAAPVRGPLVDLALSEMAFRVRPLGVALRAGALAGTLPPVYSLPDGFPADEPAARRTALLGLLDRSAELSEDIKRDRPPGYVLNVLAMIRESDRVCRSLLRPVGEA
jgi:hypothetical protein